MAKASKENENNRLSKQALEYKPKVVTKCREWTQTDDQTNTKI